MTGIGYGKISADDSGPVYYIASDDFGSDVVLCEVDDVETVTDLLAEFLVLSTDCSRSEALKAIASLGGVRSVPHWYGDAADSHSCRRHMVGDGFCSWCGAVIPGTMAYRDLFGGEL